MTRQKVVVIDSCRDCPYRVGWGSDMRCGRVFEAGAGEAEGDAAALGRLTPYSGCVIPKWCPLPDAPKAEEVKTDA